MRTGESFGFLNRQKREKEVVWLSRFLAFLAVHFIVWDNGSVFNLTQRRKGTKFREACHCNSFLCAFVPLCEGNGSDF